MFYTAVIMGLVGSFHCAGMCAPLALAVTRNRPFLRTGILYNSGRILLYALLGALAATFGSALHLAPYQQVLSVLLGIAFILSGLGRRLPVALLGRGVNRLTGHLKKIFGKALQKKNNLTTFLLGMINGMLPCGLTYLALSACLILPSAGQGFMFMIFFGLGTWPVMIGFLKLLNISKLNSAFSPARFSRIGMIAVGSLLLLRVFWVHPHQEVLSSTGTAVSVCK